MWSKMSIENKISLVLNIAGHGIWGGLLNY